MTGSTEDRFDDEHHAVFVEGLTAPAENLDATVVRPVMQDRLENLGVRGRDALEEAARYCCPARRDRLRRPSARCCGDHVRPVEHRTGQVCVLGKDRLQQDALSAADVDDT